MTIDELSIRDEIPIGKGLICDNIATNEFLIEIGKRYERSTLISHTTVFIPKSSDRIYDLKRVKQQLAKYGVEPIFNVKEHSFGGKTLIAKLQEQDYAHITG